MDFTTQNVEKCLGILSGMKGVPTAQAHTSPVIGFQFNGSHRFMPCIGVFEGKAMSMNGWTTPSTIRWRRAIQNPITAQAHQQGTRCQCQSTQKPVIAVASIAHNHIHARAVCPLLAQPLHLSHTGLYSVHLWRDALVADWQCPTAACLWHP